MSIEIDTYLVLQALSVPDEAIKLMAENNIEVNATLKYVSIKHKALKIAEIPINSKKVAELISGASEPTPQNITDANVAALHALTKVTGSAPPVFSDATAPTTPVSKGSILQPKKTVMQIKKGGPKFPLVSDKVSTTEKTKTVGYLSPDLDNCYDPVPASFMKAENRIPLIQATNLYHPVESTDSTSMYFLVAASENVKIAARYNDGYLSIRAEGDMTQKAIVKAGLTKKGSNTHASNHMVTESHDVAARCIGAVMAGFVGEDFKTQVPDIEVIVGKGL